MRTRLLATLSAALACSIAAVTFAMSSGIAALSAPPSSKSHFFVVEYAKPVGEKDAVATLTVTFYTPTDGKAAEAFVRAQLEASVKAMPPASDILANAWFSKNGVQADDEMIKLPDGSTSLIYSQRYKAAMTMIEYQAKESKAPAGSRTLEVKMDGQLVAQNGGSVVRGTTNLPNGTTLMLSLRQQATKYFAQSKATVADGRFTSEPFSKNGAALAKGDYELDIVMPLASLQPEAVQKVIGKKCELVSGPLVKVSGLGKTVEFSKTVQVQ